MTFSDTNAGGFLFFYWLLHFADKWIIDDLAPSFEVCRVWQLGMSSPFNPLIFGSGGQRSEKLDTHSSRRLTSKYHFCGVGRELFSVLICNNTNVSVFLCPRFLLFLLFLLIYGFGLSLCFGKLSFHHFFEVTKDMSISGVRCLLHEVGTSFLSSLFRNSFFFIFYEKQRFW